MKTKVLLLGRQFYHIKLGRVNRGFSLCCIFANGVVGSGFRAILWQKVIEMNAEFFGWIGSALFAICGLPQALQSIKDGHSRGLNWFFILAWLGGEIFTIIYVWPKMDIPLLANYLINLIFLGIMLKYKIWERV